MNGLEERKQRLVADNIGLLVNGNDVNVTVLNSIPEHEQALSHRSTRNAACLVSLNIPHDNTTDSA
jgi:hypothetical protein